MTTNETNIIYPDLSSPSPPPSPLRGEGKGEGPSGYKLGILVNFSKSKVEYRRVLIRWIRYHSNNSRGLLR
jgi:hypothetical protein